MSAGAEAAPAVEPGGRERTAQQRVAIDARDRDVFLRAGAGTGKTSVLVDRFCAAALDPDCGVERILAFTFTERAAARDWMARSWTLVHPWGSGGVYPNFPDPDLQDWAHAYYGTNYDRLRRVKAAYDPDGFFGFQQSLS